MTTITSSTIFPNLLILGAARSGTTTLYKYLDSHPQVFMSSLKEPYFFGIEGEKLDYKDPESAINKNGITHLDDYLALFREAHGYKVVGEGSTNYLYSEKAANNIKKYTPNARLVMILRQPVERAYSNYMMMRRDGRETLNDFVTAFNIEQDRISANWGFGWHYKSLGMYSQQVNRYKNLFSPNQLRIYLYDDLTKDISGLCNNLCNYLEIDSIEIKSNDRRENRSGIPKYGWLTHLIRRYNPVKRIAQSLFPVSLRKKVAQSLLEGNLQKSPPLDPAIRQKMIGIYRNDILMLQDIIQRDLSAWLK